MGLVAVLVVATLGFVVWIWTDRSLRATLIITALIVAVLVVGFFLLRTGGPTAVSWLVVLLPLLWPWLRGRLGRIIAALIGRTANPTGANSTGARSSFPRGDAMTIHDAMDVLGLEQTDLTTLDPATVQRAYHHMMQKLHPDHGGSTYFATRLTQARDLLMEALTRS